jgi:hypothetical protein
MRLHGKRANDPPELICDAGGRSFLSELGAAPGRSEFS